MGARPLSSLPDPALPADRPLTVPLLIRGSYDHPLLVALWSMVGIFACLGVYSALRARVWDAALAYWSLSALVAVPGTLLGLWIRRQRHWLEVTLTGFVVSRRGQRRVYSDDQVASVAQSARSDSEGNIKRRVVLEV